MANRALRSSLAAAISILIAAYMLSMNMDTTEAVPVAQDPEMQTDDNYIRQTMSKMMKIIRPWISEPSNMAKVEDFIQLANDTLVLVNKVANHEAERLNGSAQRDSLLIETLPLVKQVAQHEFEWLPTLDSNCQTKSTIVCISEEDKKILEDIIRRADKTLTWLGSGPVDPVAVCILLAIIAILLMLAGWTYLLARRSQR